MRTLLASLALLLITVGTARAEFQAPGPQVRHQFAEPMADLNERAARMFNKVLDVEQTIYLTSDRCGEANAFYLPAKGRTAPTVVLCSELARDVLQEFRHENLSRRQLQAAIQGNMVFILLHEVGHALIDVLNLPVVGEEENAVDQFSALFMSDMPNLVVQP